MCFGIKRTYFKKMLTKTEIEDLIQQNTPVVINVNNILKCNESIYFLTCIQI